MWNIFEVNNKNTSTSCKVCSKLTINALEQGVKYVQNKLKIKTPEQR